MSNDLTLSLSANRKVWSVLMDNVVMAKFVLDDLGIQIEEIFLLASAPEMFQLETLWLAVSHAIQCANDREIPFLGGLLMTWFRNRPSHKESCVFMKFAKTLPEVKGMARKKAIRILRRIGVIVTVVTYDNVASAIDAAIGRLVGVSVAYKFVVLDKKSVGKLNGFDGSVNVLFTINDKKLFTFWKKLSVPSERYIIPRYHPISRGCGVVGAVNGGTNSYSGNTAIDFVYCPSQERMDRHGNGFLGDWVNVGHPYRVQNNKLAVTLNPVKIRSNEGVKGLADFLSAAIGLCDGYVTVVNGFKTPFPRHTEKHPIKDETNTAVDCVWQFCTLKEEGELDDAEIPEWFWSGIWSEIYCEVSPGVGKKSIV